MGESIKQNGTQYESSIDNLGQELLRVKRQVQQELSNLQKDVQEDKIKKDFFEKIDEKVVYNIDLVKKYLESCAQQDEVQINSAVVMAVQIALEALGKDDYDVGKIDGLLKSSSGTQSNTEKAIRKFQKENNLYVDGVPGKETITKILEILPDFGNGNFDGKSESEGENEKEDQDKKETKNENINAMQLLALEIYRGKIMTNEEIEKKGYNPEEILKMAKNKKLMGIIDKMIPYRKKITDKKENLDNKEEAKKENNEIKESRETTDILVGPRLKATNRKEVGGIGSSIMYGFQGYGSRGFGFTNMAGRESGKADDSWFNEENGKLYENYILPRSELIDYCKNHKIKSFMFYFGGNEKTDTERQTTLTNIEKWGDYLEKGGIQPVLCTCIGEDIKQHQDSTGKPYVKEYNAAIKDMQQRKGWPLLDFVKVDQPNIFRPNDGWHPGDTGYQRMGTKIEQCFSSAEN